MLHSLKGEDCAYREPQTTGSLELTNGLRFPSGRWQPTWPLIGREQYLTAR